MARFIVFQCIDIPRAGQWLPAHCDRSPTSRKVPPRATPWEDSGDEGEDDNCFEPDDAGKLQAYEWVTEGCSRRAQVARGGTAGRLFEGIYTLSLIPSLGAWTKSCLVPK